MKNENVRKVIMGADPNGMTLKNFIRDHLREEGYDVTDVDPEEPVLYQDAAKAVATAVQSGVYDRGIALCGTGMGVSIICNKHRGIYAALCESVYQARRSKTINNTNVLCMGGFIIGNVMGLEMANAWLEAEHLKGISSKEAEACGKEFNELVEFEKSVYSK